MTYLLSGQSNNANKPARKSIQYRVYRCFFLKCVVPTPPPAPSGRPTDAKKWSTAGDWAGAPDGFARTTPVDGRARFIYLFSVLSTGKATLVNCISSPFSALTKSS